MADPIFPQSLTTDKLTRFREDNPTLTPHEIIHAYIDYRSKKEGRSAGDIVLEEYPGLRGQRPPPGAVIGSPGFAGGAVPFEAVGEHGTTGDPNDPSGIKAGVRQLGMTAVGALSGVGMPASVLGRLGMTAGRGATMGAGTSAVVGDNPVSGAVEGGLTAGAGQVLGEAIPGVTNLAKRVWDLSTQTFRTGKNLIKWSDAYAKSALQGAIQEFPEFARVLGGAKSYADGLMKLVGTGPRGTGQVRGKMLGTQYLSDTIERSERMVKAVLGGDDAMITAPTLRRALMTQAEREMYGQVHTGALPIPAQTQPWPVVGPAGPRMAQTPIPGTGSPGIPGHVVDVAPPMTVKEAFHGLKLLTEEARLAGKTPEAMTLWATADKARGELLGRVPKRLASEYTEALSHWGDGLEMLQALKKGFESPMTTSPTKSVYNINGTLENLRIRDLHEFFGKFNNTVLKGAESGARETITGGFRAREYKSGASLGISVPGHRTAPLGGNPPRSGHRPSNVITGLSIPGISATIAASEMQGGYLEP